MSVDGSLHVGGGITGETVELIFGLIAALHQDVDTLRGENTELHEENRELHEENRELRGENRELRTELSAMQANFTGQVQNTHTVYNYRLQQVESLVEDMNEQLEDGIPNWEATPSPIDPDEQFGPCDCSLDAPSISDIEGAEYHGDVRGSGSAIAEFFTEWSNISIISGGVHLTGGALESVHFFQNISLIRGHLRILECANLESLAGFESLRGVGGNVLIARNDQLTSIDALEALEVVNGFFKVVNNAVLQNISGLNALQHVDGSIEITENAAVRTISGFNGVEVVGGSVLIGSEQDSLESVSGFNGEGFREVGGSVLFEDMDEAFAIIAGFTFLRTIAGDLGVVGCSSLVDYHGFSNLHTLGGALHLERTRGQSFIDNLHSLERLGGLTLEEASITSLDALQHVTFLFAEGDLRIANNNALTHLDELSSLTSVGGYLSINTNAALTTLDGLSSLTSVGGYFSIHSNAALTTLDGLSSLTSVGGFLGIYNNAALTDISGLSGLTEVLGEYIRMCGNAQLSAIPEFYTTLSQGKTHCHNYLRPGPSNCDC